MYLIRCIVYRVCNSDGNWDGETPLCHPITCGQPPQVKIN